MNDEDVLKLIGSMKPKTCELDPVPTCTVKRHAGVLWSIIRGIINTSLRIAEFGIHNFMEVCNSKATAEETKLEQRLKKLSTDVKSANDI